MPEWLTKPPGAILEAFLPLLPSPTDHICRAPEYFITFSKKRNHIWDRHRFCTSYSTILIHNNTIAQIDFYCGRATLTLYINIISFLTWFVGDHKFPKQSSRYLTSSTAMCSQICRIYAFFKSGTEYMVCRAKAFVRPWNDCSIHVSLCGNCWKRFLYNDD